MLMEYLMAVSYLGAHCLFGWVCGKVLFQLTKSSTC